MVVMFDSFALETEDITKAKYCFTSSTLEQDNFMVELVKSSIYHDLDTSDKGLSYFSKYDNCWHQIDLDRWDLPVLAAVIDKLKEKK